MNTDQATHWRHFTGDPNTAEACEYRRRRLAAAHRPPIFSRAAYLRELARGRRVLNVGAADHYGGSRSIEKWLHQEICATAAYCLGVDVLAEEVRKLQQQGHNVRLCDITREVVGERFDVIVCKVIEHLGNPGALFEAAQRHLLPGGRLVVKAPNPYALWRIKHNLRGEVWDSVDHVALHWPPGITELAERQGMRLDRYFGVAELARTWKSRALIRCLPVLAAMGLAREAVCETIVYECVRADENTVP